MLLIRSLLFVAFFSLVASEVFRPLAPTFLWATFWGSLGSYSLCHKASSAFQASLKALLFLAEASALRPVTLKAVADGWLFYLSEGGLCWSL